MKLNIVFFLVFTTFSAAAQVSEQGPENTPNPGNTGVNAFEFIKFVEDPTIGDKVYIDIELASASNLIGNAQSIIFRLDVPISEIISVGGSLRAEGFTNNDSAIEQYNINDKNGFVVGDLSFYTKIRLLEEKHNLPQLALKVTVKTASGGFKDDRQFTDSAGYEFALTAAKTLYENQQRLIKKIRAFIEFAFIAWDTQLAQQNDAYKASMGISFQTNKLTIDVSTLYYKGWLEPELDRYLAARIKATYTLPSGIMLTTEARKGFTPAAPSYYVGGGIRIPVFTGKNKKKKKRK